LFRSHAARACWVVVRWIAVAEAVGHDQIDNIIGRPTLKAARARERRRDLKGCFDQALWRRQMKRAKTRRSVGCDPYVRKQICARRIRAQIAHTQPRTSDSNLRAH